MDLTIYISSDKTDYFTTYRMEFFHSVTKFQIGIRYGVNSVQYGADQIPLSVFVLV